MSENIGGTPREEYPDDKSPEYAGCYMYAFYKLGLDPDEARMGVSLPQLSEFLMKTNQKESADALIIKHRFNGRIDHMVFIDQAHSGIMKQRGNVGWPIEQVSLETLLSHYKPDQYEYIYFKKTKSKGNGFFEAIVRRIKN